MAESRDRAVAAIEDDIQTLQRKISGIAQKTAESRKSANEVAADVEEEVRREEGILEGLGEVAQTLNQTIQEIVAGAVVQEPVSTYAEEEVQGTEVTSEEGPGQNSDVNEIITSSETSTAPAPAGSTEKEGPKVGLIDDRGNMATIDSFPEMEPVQGLDTTTEQVGAVTM